MRLAGPMPAQLTRMRAGPWSAAAFLTAASARGAVGDVAGDGDAVDVDRDLGGRLLVDVDDRDLGAGGGERARGGGAEAGSAAGDDCRLSFDFHQLAFLAHSVHGDDTRDDSGVA